MREEVAITTPFIKLDAFLKLANLVGSGGAAKLLVQDGRVLVDGTVCTQRGKKLVAGNVVQLVGRQESYRVTAAE